MIRNISFMGANLQLEDSLFYHTSFDYWISINRDEGLVTFGLTPASHIKEGGYHSFEYFTQEGETVVQGEPFALAITGKLKYLDVVASGVIISLNRELEQSTAPCQNAVGDSCWLASIRTGKEVEMLPDLIEFSYYVELLRMYEMHRTPPGTKGAVSPTCRSVYESIRKQKGVEGG